MSTAVEAGKWPAHPVADLFPRMTDEELADLAADIKANGLIHPIVVDQKGLLIDGRNRAKACEIAGIEPTVRMFEGDDPRAFILSMNLKRRHMSAGQQAMAHAMIYPEPEKGGRGKKSKNSTETLGFSAMRLSQARTVLSHSRDVAIEILAGTKFLDKEYATAKKRTVQRGAVRAKKVPVLPDKCAVDALAKARAVTVTAPASAHAANETDAGPTAKPKPAPSDSVEALAEFKAACDLWLPQLNERDRDKASTHVN
ncbi:MAG: ParB N-terminal domain-containing protein, partial [Steroidobacteraceae bacterium]